MHEERRTQRSCAAYGTGSEKARGARESLSDKKFNEATPRGRESMMTKSAFRTAASLAAFACASAWSGIALAQDTGETLPQAAEDEAATGPEIVVTGSLIRGSSEEAPAPVDVITADELAKQGNPSVLDLIKNLPTSNGVIGDANQFDSRSQGNEGATSINLRGLGPQRTLV